MKRIKLFLLLVLTSIFCCACGSEANGTVEGENLSELVSVVDEYFYVDSIGQAKHALIVKNNSSKTVTVTANVTAKDMAGKVIGAETGSKNAIASNTEACVYNLFQNVKEATSFEYVLTVEEYTRHEPITQDISIEQSVANEKVVVLCTNNGEESATNVVIEALFLKEGKLVSYDVNHVVNDIGAGATIAEELKSYQEFDEAKVYISGWR